jgi:[ribosomal protein S5]-alanine N-acetyltransferase
LVVAGAAHGVRLTRCGHGRRKIRRVTDAIRTDRLELWLLTPGDLRALADGGRPPDLGATTSDNWCNEIRWLAGRRLTQIEEHPDHAPWLLRAIVLADGDRPAIGHMNFHGPPDERGIPEVGYGLLPEYRGKSYAIEAVRGLFDWARDQHGVTRFRASVSPHNTRSQNLIRKLGLVQVGEQWDEEDGLEWVFETP